MVFQIKNNNFTDLIKEVDGGNLTIVRRDGTVVYYSILTFLSLIKAVPAATPLKLKEFSALKMHCDDI